MVRRGPYARIFFRGFKPGEVFEHVVRFNGKPGRGKIVDLRDIFTLPDTLAGIVEYGCGDEKKYSLLIGEEIIEELGGKRLGGVLYMEPLPDGRVAGTAPTGDPSSPWIFFKGDKVIDRIGGREIIDVSEDGFAVLPDGTLIGNVEIEEDVWEAFRRESFIKEIGGRKVDTAEILQV